MLEHRPRHVAVEVAAEDQDAGALVVGQGGQGGRHVLGGHDLLAHLDVRADELAGPLDRRARGLEAPLVVSGGSGRALSATGS